MSADCFETTRLLGGDGAETFRMMGDTGRKEEGLSLTIEHTHTHTHTHTHKH